MNWELVRFIVSALLIVIGLFIYNFVVNYFTISNNDFVWVDISCKTPTGDGIYMFCIGDRLVIKRVQINPFDNSLKILSLLSGSFRITSNKLSAKLL